jgi:hypothetical protein
MLERNKWKMKFFSILKNMIIAQWFIMKSFFFSMFIFVLSLNIWTNNSTLFYQYSTCVKFHGMRWDGKFQNHPIPWDKKYLRIGPSHAEQTRFWELFHLIPSHAEPWWGHVLVRSLDVFIIWYFGFQHFILSTVVVWIQIT